MGSQRQRIALHATSHRIAAQTELGITMGLADRNRFANEASCIQHMFSLLAFVAFVPR